VVQDIFSIIREINRQGVTVLLIEQNANMALKIADLAYVLETGNITMSGTGAELLEALERGLHHSSLTGFYQLCRMVEEAIEAGATTINIPDTVGRLFRRYGCFGRRESGRSESLYHSDHCRTEWCGGDKGLRSDGGY